MEDAYEKSRKAILELKNWYNSNINEKTRNEATTRLHMIDTILFECLGWNKEECVAEESYNGQYTDYSLFCPNRTIIVEAKREGIYFELPAGYTGIEYSLKSLIKDNKKIGEALYQVADYCQKRGTLIGAICNGHQIICFIATRADGVSPMDANGIVFSSLEIMVDKFFTLWKYLSKPGILENNLNNKLIGIKITHLPSKMSNSVTPYPGIKGRNELQTDLQIIGDLVIEDITKNLEIEKEFIESCFCSSGALSQYALVSKSILEHRYEALFSSETEEPSLSPAMTKKGINIESDVLAASLSKRPILLLGDVGAGKTMFIKYFINVAAEDVVINSVVIYIDLGSTATLTANIKDSFLNEIERQLNDIYKIDIYERKIVKGVYNLDLKRFESGIYSKIKSSNPNLYAEKELQFLEDKIKNKEEHIKRCLNHISKGQNKQIIIFLDNADQRNESFQQSAFIISQEVAMHWTATIFLSIRPQTFHKSKKEGVLSAYHPKAFSISPPRVDEVINKRLRFAKRIADGELQITKIRSDIFIKLQKLNTYLDVLIYSFENNLNLIKFIDNVCTGNIRLALEFVTTFIGSGHVNTKKILDIEAETSRTNEHYLIPFHEFLRAVIYGDNNHYDPNSSHIVNIFDIFNPDGREHFLLSIIIDFVSRAGHLPSSSGFVDKADIISYAQNIGYTPKQIQNCLNLSLQKKLLESEKRAYNGKNMDLPASFRETSSGLYHVNNLVTNFSYIDAIIVDTPILDISFRNKIINVFDINDRLSRALVFCEYLDKQWDLVNKSNTRYDWTDKSTMLKRDIHLILGHQSKNYQIH